MVRMTNTFLEAGADDPDDIIRQTPYGLYCVALGGGQVNTATGDFVFGITEAYMIEDGDDHRARSAPRSSSATVPRPCSASTWSATTSTRGPARAARTVRGFRCRRASRRCGSAELTVGGTAA